MSLIDSVKKAKRTHDDITFQLTYVKNRLGVQTVCILSLKFVMLP